ncbi:hypothetical protein HYH02_001447 [Chlamydomonas schloesseri]|uniref:Uncharacterized protein n=1 Tax=Chlamydomonas schloesseri TaxID=2026947 RepID=A0A835WVZ3_9CHLO|nr:hypothetical protein HYH02_001447 [Chlamydomonas schloesseri]|eukprot:KAG2454427.1 hypothetical protein HYH02_001447 [Chlamydomonas schloesseri]
MCARSLAVWLRSHTPAAAVVVHPELQHAAICTAWSRQDQLLDRLLRAVGGGGSGGGGGGAATGAAAGGGLGPGVGLGLGPGVGLGLGLGLGLLHPLSPQRATLAMSRHNSSSVSVSVSVSVSAAGSFLRLPSFGQQQ